MATFDKVSGILKKKVKGTAAATDSTKRFRPVSSRSATTKRVSVKGEVGTTTNPAQKLTAIAETTKATPQKKKKLQKKVSYQASGVGIASNLKQHTQGAGSFKPSGLATKYKRKVASAQVKKAIGKSTFQK